MQAKVFAARSERDRAASVSEASQTQSTTSHSQSAAQSATQTATQSSTKPPLWVQRIHRTERFAQGCSQQLPRHPRGWCSKGHRCLQQASFSVPLSRRVMIQRAMWRHRHRSRRIDTYAHTIIAVCMHLFGGVRADARVFDSDEEGFQSTRTRTRTALVSLTAQYLYSYLYEYSAVSWVYSAIPRITLNVGVSRCRTITG
jgi:hypothetical protein